MCQVDISIKQKINNSPSLTRAKAAWSNQFARQFTKSNAAFCKYILREKNSPFKSIHYYNVCV